MVTIICDTLAKAVCVCVRARARVHAYTVIPIYIYGTVKYMAHIYLHLVL